jgi:hypothetical protein
MYFDETSLQRANDVCGSSCYIFWKKAKAVPLHATKVLGGEEV